MRWESRWFMLLLRILWIIFGINSAEDLPKIKEILKQEITEATKIEREENIENKEEAVVKEITSVTDESNGIKEDDSTEIPQ